MAQPEECFLPPLLLPQPLDGVLCLLPDPLFPVPHCDFVSIVLGLLQQRRRERLHLSPSTFVWLSAQRQSQMQCVNP